jgi:uncharacterized protein
MRLTLLACSVVQILALCGCRSAPIAYYTLTPESRSGSTVENSRPVLRTALVLRSLPVGIDSTQIMVRTDDARERVEEGGRWAAPLGDELRDALVDALRHQSGIIVMDGARHQDAPMSRIDLTVLGFDIVEGGSVTLAVDWMIADSKPGSGPSLSCQAEFTERSTASLGGAVSAGQATVLKLARVLGSAVQAVSNGATPTC